MSTTGWGSSSRRVAQEGSLLAFCLKSGLRSFARKCALRDRIRVLLRKADVRDFGPIRPSSAHLGMPSRASPSPFVPVCVCVCGSGGQAQYLASGRECLELPPRRSMQCGPLHRRRRCLSLRADLPSGSCCIGSDRGRGRAGEPCGGKRLAQGRRGAEGRQCERQAGGRARSARTDGLD